MASGKAKKASMPRSSDAAVVKNGASSGRRSASTSKSAGNSQLVERTVAAQEVLPLSWKSIVQSTTSDVPPLFTRDADYYFLASASSVQIHSRATGAVVSTLTPPASAYHPQSSSAQLCASHAGHITAIMLHPTNPLQLLTASLDGTIKVWDFLDGILLRSIGVGGPITHMAAHATLKGSVVVVTRKPQAQSGQDGAGGKRPSAFALEGLDEKDARARSNAIFLLVSLSAHRSAVLQDKGTSGLSTVRSASLKRIGKARVVSGLAITADGAWVVATGNRKLHIARLASLDDGFVKVITDEIVTRLAVHPSENVFATGDARGRIRLWPFLDDSTFWETAKATGGQGENGPDQRAVSTLLHWHAHAVSALAFTANGATLLSGGEEAVLVLWSLQSSAREYVPRLGAPIAAISNAPATSESGADSQTGYAITLRDGSFVLVGALNRKIIRTFSGVKIDVSRAFYPQAQRASLPAPFATEPGTGHLVLPAGHASGLQFYAPTTHTFAGELEVAPSNRVSRPGELPIEPTRVERVVFSASAAQSTSSAEASSGTNRAEWMATIDGRSSGSFTSELCLKIWHYESAASRYVLNTRIDAPHEGRITSVSFSRGSFGTGADTAPLLVTTGDDGKVKTFRLASHRVKGGRVERYWVVRSVFGYRDTIPTDAVFSSDATSSVLAVSQGEFVTLWDTRTNALLDVLTCPEVRKVVGCNFVASDGEGDAPRFLAAFGTRTIVLWDLVDATVVYTTDVGDDHVVTILPSPRDDEARDHRMTVNFASVSTVRGQKSSRVRTHRHVEGETAPTEGSSTLPIVIRVAQPSPSMQRIGPSFYAITDSFDIVHVGAGPAEAKTATNLRSVNGTTAHRTLFDALLGAKANTTWSPVAATTVQAPLPIEYQTSAKAGPDRLKQVMHILDAPPHLLPPVRLLASSLFDALLPPAPAKIEVVAAAVVDQDGADAEEQMDVDEEDRPTPGARRTDAALELARLETDIPFLTDLFRTQLAMPAGPAPVAASNGTPASAKAKGGRKSSSSFVNGAAGLQQNSPPTSNSKPRQSSSLAKPNGTPVSGSKGPSAKTTPVVVLPGPKTTPSSASGSARKRKTVD